MKMTKKMDLTLTDLTPFTRYDIRITCIPIDLISEEIKGFWSKPTETKAMTLEDGKKRIYENWQLSWYLACMHATLAKILIICDTFSISLSLSNTLLKPVRYDQTLLKKIISTGNKVGIHFYKTLIKLINTKSFVSSFGSASYSAFLL